MVKIFICTECKSNKCGQERAIEIYEEFRNYTHAVGEIELIMTKCQCKEGCKGHTIQIDQELYVGIEADEIKELLYLHFGQKR
ncbi:hypothetical protein [Geosporobacter ferrireducens]|uniref:(2Fe-2S) ferredoxin domain-containing protein n=2 Tax=Geosporobacter ferrireducens TaxID=1424294 RepID=A0A1D8GE13_9FIRM|nr:hypothetical protein [Geosporobacter ferrireducens]AOT69151.1 hypothetical protein Gferi_05995 [Geosporobacter ferrireducens]MTI56829.1 hypothetical protein [Geosporobacter ferrireducens]